MPETKKFKIRIDYDDGSYQTLEGNDAEKWLSYVDSCEMLAGNHRMFPPDLNWKIFDEDGNLQPPIIGAITLREFFDRLDNQPPVEFYDSPVIDVQEATEILLSPEGQEAFAVKK
jgi:hypothetical protein